MLIELLDCARPQIVCAGSGDDGAPPAGSARSVAAVTLRTIERAEAHALEAHTSR